MGTRSALFAAFLTVAASMQAASANENSLAHPDLLETDPRKVLELSHAPFAQAQQRRAVEADVATYSDARLSQKSYALACSGKLEDPDAVLTHEERAVINEMTDITPSEERVRAYETLLADHDIENRSLAVMAAGLVQDYNRTFPIPKCAIDENILAQADEFVRMLGLIPAEQFSEFKKMLPDSFANISLEDVQNKISTLTEEVQRAFNNDGSVTTPEALSIERLTSFSDFIPNEPIEGADVVAPQVLKDIGLNNADDELVDYFASSLSAQMKMLEFIRQNEDTNQIFGPLLDYERGAEALDFER